MMTQYIYAFDEGRISMKNLLGGKGANLSEMKRLGLPVPDGFTITTEACIDYLKKVKIKAIFLPISAHCSFWPIHS